MELMGGAATDGSAIRLHCPKPEATAGKNARVGFVHEFVSLLQ